MQRSVDCDPDLLLTQLGLDNPLELHPAAAGYPRYGGVQRQFLSDRELPMAIAPINGALGRGDCYNAMSI